MTARWIPFLGAGVNACGQSRGQFRLGERMPSGGELRRDYLAEACGYLGTHADDLARVSQYLATTEGDASAVPRNRHKVFDIDAAAHGAASICSPMLPQYVRERQAPLYPLILTTNYDTALEVAFEACRASPTTYRFTVHPGRAPGQVHAPPAPGGETRLVDSPNDYYEGVLAERARQS